jgi:hypothetical protein
VRKQRSVAAVGSSPTQVLQLAHGPARDVVEAGAVAKEGRQDVEVDNGPARPRRRSLSFGPAMNPSMDIDMYSTVADIVRVLLLVELRRINSVMKG